MHGDVGAVAEAVVAGGAGQRGVDHGRGAVRVQPHREVAVAGGGGGGELGEEPAAARFASRGAGGAANGRTKEVREDLRETTNFCGK